MAQKTGKAKFDHELVVKFKGVSISDTTARIGFSVDRDEIELDDADHLFCGAVLSVRLEFDPQRDKDTKGQKQLMDTAMALAIQAEVKRYSVAPDMFSASLVTPKDGVPTDTLSKFAGVKGILRCTRTAAAKQESDKPEE